MYDNVKYHRRMLLDLPFLEGTGIITQDVAKPHHPITLANTPTWSSLASGKQILTLDGSTEYLQCLNASCLDLGFTSGDYSIGGCFEWTTAGDDSQIIIGRYQVDVGGWELYLYSTGAMTLRHHHAAGATIRTGCYSMGWGYDAKAFFGVSRSGSSGQFYRNGAAITTVSDVLIDPEATDQDLVIGVRFSKSDNNFKGNFGRLFIAGEALSADDWSEIYELEKAGYLL